VQGPSQNPNGTAPTLPRRSWTAGLLVLLLTLGIASSAANAQTPQALFPIATQLKLSPFGFPVFAGDFNGDGVPDLAYITENNSLEIALSVGTNAPTTVTTQLTCPSTAGQAPMSFADVNHDKKLDLVYSCSGYIVIQLGNGDGTFATPAYSAINAGSPVLVDLNGDGFADITAFTVSGTSLEVAVFLNQGAANPGVFQNPKLYPVPSGSSSLLAGDFNGDGKQDLITTSVNTSTGAALSTAISILYGDGDGTLKPAATQSTPSFSGFTIGDLNGDGVTDLALLLVPATNTSLYTSVQVLLGSTSGTFAPGASLPIVANSAANLGGGQPLAAVALTGDGNLDLVVDTSVLSIFHGDGKGNFAATGTYAITGSPNIEGAPMLFADLTSSGLGLIFGDADATFYFPGNGDGTLQAALGTPVAGPIADVNNDGIADIVFAPPQGGPYFGTALGRGDGTFSILDQTTPLPGSANYYLLMTGDFNKDGKIDAIAIQPGSAGGDPCAQPPNSQLLSYLGSGDGRFQAVGTALPLGVSFASAGVTGDFNSDGNPDLILPYGACPLGLLFVPGQGDGTFGTPVPLSSTQTDTSPGLLVGDLNNDGKLDFIWGNGVFLGNGDGTFKQIPLTIPAATQRGPDAAALADLNGDGILDAVSSAGTAIYAGIGDGTFATTPFYTVPLPQNTYGDSFATADVNGDGNPDLLLVESGGGAPFLGVYLGNGHGNFTQDSNTYYVSAGGSSLPANAAVAARLNSQAPPPASDNKLDVLITMSSAAGSSTYMASLLNQTNPVPVKPAPITSTTALQASPSTGTPGTAITLTASVFGTEPTGSVSFTANGNSLGTEALSDGSATLETSFANPGSYTIVATYLGDSNNAGSSSSTTGVTIGQATTTTALQASPSSGNVNAQITLQATVTGSLPTGSVSFVAGATSLGKATLSNGVATLQTSFAAAGSYSTTAVYQGDANNLASTSSPATIVIAAPDFTVTATPTSGSVTPGQSGTFTFTVTPEGGYVGTVKFSCGAVPSLAACSFSPASVTPAGASPVSSTLTVTTAAATAMLSPSRSFGPSRPPSSPWVPAGGLALAGVMGLAFAPARLRRWNRELRLLSSGLLLASLALSIMGCGGGGQSTPSSPGTPAGSYTISVNATDSSSGPQHAVSITLSVQ
jgi:hypothetical protein